MTTNLILVGGGAFARELLEWVTAVGLPPGTELKGYLAASSDDVLRHLADEGDFGCQSPFDDGVHFAHVVSYQGKSGSGA